MLIWQTLTWKCSGLGDISGSLRAKNLLCISRYMKRLQIGVYQFNTLVLKVWPQADNISITWELVGNANAQTPPQIS